MFMRKYPHNIELWIYHQRKKSGTKSGDEEIIGYAELNTEDLISLDNYGCEVYMYLEDSTNKNSLIKIRTLFVPSVGTIERFNLDLRKCIFKNALQYLFFKVLHMDRIWDEYGYLVPLGNFLYAMESDQV
jgi:hypothetical protein